MSFGTNTNGYLDTKDFRTCVLTRANKRLGLIVKTIQEGGGTLISKKEGMLSLLDSTYKADVPSTSYGMHLKSIAYESGRFLCSLEETGDDIYFEDTRGEYLSQTVASFLFPGYRFAHTDSTDAKVRNFYLSIIEAYFGGSTRENIENSIIRFVEVPVGIVENYLLARGDSNLDTVINKFTFDIVIQVDDPRIKDVTQLQEDIEFLINIIKPAHTTYETKFIFTELFDIFRKGCLTRIDSEGFPQVSYDGFEVKTKLANTSICDKAHIDYHDYFYEDFRKEGEDRFAIPVEREIVQEISEEYFNTFQASPRLVKTLEGGRWNYPSDRHLFHTHFGPFANKDGTGLADAPTDITVYVNGVFTEVIEIYPLSATFRLENIPDEDAKVEVSYYILRDYIGALITNDYDSVTNNWKNSATEFNYKTVLTPTNFAVRDKNTNIFEKQCRYQGFDLYNSSVLNSAITLNYNELGVRNNLNDAHVFKSFGYDHGQYISKLREGMESVPNSLDQKDVWRRIPFQEIRMNNSEFLMNTREDRMLGELHHPSYHPFYSALEFDCIDNGGEKVILNSIHEDSEKGMQLELGMSFSASGMMLGKDYECQLYTYPSKSPSASYDAFFTTLNDINCTLMGGNAVWDFGDEIAVNPSGYFGGNHSQGHIAYNEIIPEEYALEEMLTVEDETNFILRNTETINNLYRVTNLSKANYNLFGSHYYSYLDLDESNSLNESIGLDSLDQIKIFYSEDGKTYSHDLDILDQGDFNFGIFRKFPKDYQVVNTTRKYTHAPEYDLANYDLYSNIYLDKSLPENSFIGLDELDIIEAVYFDPSGVLMTDAIVIIDADNFIFKTTHMVQDIASVRNITKSSNYYVINSVFRHFVDLDRSLIDNTKISLNFDDKVEIAYIDSYDITQIEEVDFENTTNLIFEISDTSKVITSVKNLTHIPEYSINGARDFSILTLDSSNPTNQSIDLYIGDTVEVTYSDFKNNTITENALILDPVEYILETSESIFNIRSIENKNVSGFSGFYDLNGKTIEYGIELDPTKQLTGLETTDLVEATYLSNSDELITEFVNVLNSSLFRFKTSKSIYRDVATLDLQITLNNLTQHNAYSQEDSISFTEVRLNSLISENVQLGMESSDLVKASYKTPDGRFIDEKVTIDSVDFSITTSLPVEILFDIKNITSASYDLTGALILENNFTLDKTIPRNTAIGLEGVSLNTGEGYYPVRYGGDSIEVLFENKNEVNRSRKADILDATNYSFGLDTAVANSIKKIEKDGEDYDLTNMVIDGNLITLDPSLPINQGLGLSFSDSVILHRSNIEGGINVYSQIITEQTKLLGEEMIGEILITYT